MSSLLERYLLPVTVLASVFVHGIIALCFGWLEADEPAQLLTPVPGVTSVMVQVSTAARPKPPEEIFEKALLDLPESPAPAAIVEVKPKPAEEIARPRTDAEPVAPKMTPELAMRSLPEPPRLEPIIMPKAKAPALAESKARPETTLIRPKPPDAPLPKLQPEKIMHVAMEAAPPDQLPPVKIHEMPPLKTEKEDLKSPARLTAKLPELQAEKAALELPEPVRFDPVVPPLKSADLPKKTIEKPLELPRPLAKSDLPQMEAVTKMGEPSPVSSEASAASQGVLPDELARTLPTNAPPPYPSDALAARRQGSVMLHLWIDAAGKVTKVSINSSSGVASMDQSAQTTAQSWVFAPARRRGQPVASEMLWPVEFFIRNRQ